MRRVRPAVDDRRLEETRVRRAHGAGAGERGEVGGTLAVAARRDAPSDAAEHDRADDQAEEGRQEHDGRLAALAPDTPHPGASPGPTEG